MITAQQSVKYIEGTPSALQVIEAAGRTCYKSEARITADSATAFVRGIILSGHESVIEHASATFRIVTDRGISHEIVRHRVASYSQESTRYCNYGKQARQLTFIEPPCLLTRQLEIWLRACEQSEFNYLDMLDAGAKPEIARSVLLTCLKTELVMTANFREWRHFIKMRSARVAHPQVREIAGLILAWFNESYPVVVEDILYDQNASTRAEGRAE